MRTSRLITALILSGVMVAFGSFVYAQGTGPGPGAQSGPGPEMSEEAAALLQTLKSQKAAMHEEIRALLAADPDATEEERQALILKWRAENQDRIQAQKDLVAEIRESLGTGFRAALQERMQNRKNVRERIRQRLADLTPEEREEAKVALRQKIQERRGQ